MIKTENNLSILILDDEKIALNYLEEIINNVLIDNKFYLNYKILSTTNQTDFWNLLTNNLPLIIFLDIQMPQKNGIEIAQEIRKKSKIIGYKNEQLPIIIFTTAFENYGYNAFSVQALDYILKPIDDIKIINSFNKIKKLNIEKYIDNYLIFNSNGIEMKILISDILYFKADMKYITVVTYTKEFLISGTLINFELKYTNFIKIHRSYLVNPTYINKVFKRDNNLFLSLKKYNLYLPISRRQKQNIDLF